MDGMIQWQSSQCAADPLFYRKQQAASKPLDFAPDTLEPTSSPAASSSLPSTSWLPSASTIQALTRPRASLSSLTHIPSWSGIPQVAQGSSGEGPSTLSSTSVRTINRTNISKASVRKNTSRASSGRRSDAHKALTSPRSRIPGTASLFRTPSKRIRKPSGLGTMTLPGLSLTDEPRSADDIVHSPEAGIGSPGSHRRSLSIQDVPPPSKQAGGVDQLQNGISYGQESPQRMQVDKEEADDTGMDIDSPLRSSPVKKKAPALSGKRYPPSLLSHSVPPTQSNNAQSGFMSHSQQCSFQGPTSSQSSRPPVLGMRRSNITPYSSRAVSSPSNLPESAAGPSRAPVRGSQNASSSRHSSMSTLTTLPSSSKTVKSSSSFTSTSDPITTKPPRTPRKSASQSMFAIDPLLSPSKKTYTPPASPSKRQKQKSSSFSGTSPHSSRRPIPMTTTPIMRSPARSARANATSASGARTQSTAGPAAASSRNAPSSHPSSGRSRLQSLPVSKHPPVPKEFEPGKDPESDDIDISFSYDSDQLEAVLQQLDD